MLALGIELFKMKPLLLKWWMWISKFQMYLMAPINRSRRKVLHIVCHSNVSWGDTDSHKLLLDSDTGWRHVPTVFSSACRFLWTGKSCIWWLYMQCLGQGSQRMTCRNVLITGMKMSNPANSLDYIGNNAWNEVWIGSMCSTWQQCSLHIMWQEQWAWHHFLSFTNLSLYWHVSSFKFYQPFFFCLFFSVTSTAFLQIQNT